MNQRIRELAKKCYETGPIGKDGWPEYSKFNEEKFAELLIKECVDVVSDCSVEYCTRPQIVSEIKEHFGV